MENKVYNLRLNISWSLINLINEIDSFNANWVTIESRESQSLIELKSIATVRSVGASNRIEGNKMNDEEINILLQEIDITKFVDRDSQEVAGYFEVLSLISESYKDINVTENDIKSLHNTLMKFSVRDKWHKGNYKTHNNAVEITFPNGNNQIIFQTTPAGFATEDAMIRLLNWYNSEKEIHALVKIATFVYEFLSIHPFQDGNGRLSRLISTFLLLKQGYKWVEFVSFEHEIENRKSEYYRILRSCQAQRPGENIEDWVLFFLECLKNIKLQLIAKLDKNRNEYRLSSKEKSIFTIIENNPNIQSKKISEKLLIPLSTVKRILSELSKKRLIEKQGSGRATSYLVK